MKKRSFLARGEESLARLASLAKQSDSISHTVNTRNFVFQYIDPPTNNVSKKEEKTREEKTVELQNKVIICIISIKPLWNHEYTLRFLYYFCDMFSYAPIEQAHEF